MQTPTAARRIGRRPSLGLAVLLFGSFLAGCGGGVSSTATTLAPPNTISSTSTTSTTSTTLPATTSTTSSVGSTAAAEAKLESDPSVYPAPLGGSNKFNACPNPIGVGADANPTGQLRDSLITTTRKWLETSSIDIRLSLSDRALWAQVLLGPSQNPVMSATAAESVQLQITRPTAINAYSGCYAKIVSDTALVIVCSPATATVAACDPGLSLELYVLNRSGHWLVWQELA